MNNAIRRRKVPQHMTVDEFVSWAGDGRWQLVDGEPRAMAPASATHGIIQARLAFLFNQHFYAGSSPCVAVTEPAIVPRVRSRSNMRVPDVAVTCSQVEAGQLALPEPLLIVEILSPINEFRDLGECLDLRFDPKRAEVLVLRSTSVAADLLRRRTDGTWPDEPSQIGKDDILHLESVGLTCPLTELYIGTYLARIA